MSETKKTITKRYDFVYLFDVKGGNPNGDPDAGNLPRIDPETGHGIVTDVCIKRKIRNFVEVAKKDAAGFEIYVKERGILADEQRKAYTALKDKGVKAGEQQNEKARDWMCANFYDVRTFGAVMSTGKIEGKDKEKYKELIDSNAKKPQWNCGQVQGPVQLTFARSIDPILTLEHSITRVALTNASDTRKEAVQTEEGDKAASGQFGQKNTIPYGLYCAYGFVSPHLAEKTGFSDADLELLWIALEKMYDQRPSASSGLRAAQRLIVFEHSNPLGNMAAHKLFKRVKVEPREDIQKANKPIRDYEHYNVKVDTAGLEEKGIKVFEKIYE